ncbi:MAG: site-specific DNA-methyltransferase [Elusimicrobiota bacterium]
MSHDFLDQVRCCPAHKLDWVPPESIDAIVTSIPFERMRTYSDDPQDLGLYQGREFIERLGPVISEWKRILKSTGNLFLNFMPQSIGGTLSPTNYLLPQALAGRGFHIVQQLSIIKTNALPGNDSRLLKRSVEIVFHAVKDIKRYAVNKDAVLRPSLWAARDNRSWKYRADGADGGNFIAPALERLNRLPVKDVLRMVCADEADALCIANGRRESSVHPATMDPEVAEWLVRYGAPIGGVALDNFLGSGTTAIAAKRLGRHYVGSDLNATYIAQAEAAIAEAEFGSLLGHKAASAHALVRPRGRRRGAPQRYAALACPACGKNFFQKKPWQEFCSKSCRFRYHNARRRK